MMSSIDTLPAELLVAIFSISSAVDPLSPLSLIDVCRRWSDITLTTPQIWQMIVLDTARLIPPSNNDDDSSTEKQSNNCTTPQCTLRALQRQAAMWVARSAPLPFDVSLTLHASPSLAYDVVLPLLAALLDGGGHNRWRTLAVQGPPPGQAIHISDLQLFGSPMRLEVHVAGPDWGSQERATALGYDFLDNSLGLWTHLLPSTFDLSWAPGAQIRTGLEMGMAVNWTCTLPLTHLSLREDSLDARLRPRSILRLLAACPLLEEFVFAGVPHMDWDQDDEEGDDENSESLANPDQDAVRSPMPIAQLPHLKRLHLQSTLSARTILSHVSTPSLTTLVLAHLNVEYSLPQPSSLADGDSDSGFGAGDFSRSSASDRATGMGLRALIRRCQPPIQILEMDFSDMRAKDFRWTFERLDKLIAFTIVASDMSDRVIELLRPRRGEAAVADANKVDGSWEVPLPRLQVLQLVQCDRVSGDLIVDVLKARVTVTDALEANRKDKSGSGGEEMAPEGTGLEESVDDAGPLTLTHVIVNECDKVLPEHRQALAANLGERFGLHDV